MSPEQLLRADAVLTGDDPLVVLAPGLGATGMQATSCTIRHVSRRPGRHVRVLYEVRATDGEAIEVVAVASTAALPDDVLVLESDDLQVGLFRVPVDPRLPGLAVASDPDRLGQLLGRDVEVVRRHRYRPLSRAVLDVRLADGTRLWAKTMRPEQVGRLVDLHEVLGRVAPVPTVVAAEETVGLLVTAHLPGPSVRRLVVREPSQLPPIEAVLELSDAVGEVDWDEPPGRRPPLDAVPGHVRRLLAVVPTERDRLGCIAEQLAAARDDVPPGPTAMVHGDLHASQVLADATGVTGLLDVDDAGRGYPVDDLGRFVGHLRCTLLHDRPAAAVEWGRSLDLAVRERFGERHAGPRIAAAALGVAVGPHRAQVRSWRDRVLARIELVERLLEPRARG